MSHPAAPHIAAWVFALGGVGARSADDFRERHRRDGHPFPLGITHIDTDPATQTQADVTISLALSEDQLQAMRGSPERFGPATRAILNRLAPYLTGDLTAGARTLRPFSQLYWLYHIDTVIEGLRRSLEKLAKLAGTAVIVPFILSSAAGGTGSALSVLLLQHLADPAFLQLVRLGIRTPIDRPVLMVVDPYQFPRSTGRNQALRILANMFAFRLETDWLLRHQRAAQYIFHLGYSNSAGVILDNPLTMAGVLGRSAYVLARDWRRIKAATCDGVDNDVVSDTGYLGRDTLEDVYADYLAEVSAAAAPFASQTVEPPAPPTTPLPSGEST